jgi:hypothetical protein
MEGIKAYLDCVQIGMYARGAPIPSEGQRRGQGQGRPRNSVMGSRETCLNVRSDAETAAKAGISEASAEESVPANPNSIGSIP